MLKVRTLPRQHWPMHMAVLLFALFWGIAAVAILVLVEDKMVAAGIAALGLPVFGLLLKRTGKLARDIKCQECLQPLPRPLENSMEEGEPILHHCEKCDILWFAGRTSSF